MLPGNHHHSHCKHALDVVSCLSFFKCTGLNSVLGWAVIISLWFPGTIGHAIKRGKVFKHLKSLSADINFLQETHIKITEQRRLRCNWISQVFTNHPLLPRPEALPFSFAKTFLFSLLIRAQTQMEDTLLFLAVLTQSLLLSSTYMVQISMTHYFLKRFLICFQTIIKQTL